MCTCCRYKSMLNHNNVFSSSPAAAWPPCREGLHQFVREAADWPAALPSVLRHQAGAQALHRVHGRRGRIPTPPPPPPLHSALACSPPHILCHLWFQSRSRTGSWCLVPCPLSAAWGGAGWWGGGSAVGAISHLDKLSGETPPLPLSSPPWDQAHVRGRSPGRAGQHRPELVPRTVEECVKKKKWKGRVKIGQIGHFFVLTCIFVWQPAHKSEKNVATLTKTSSSSMSTYLLYQSDPLFLPFW